MLGLDATGISDDGSPVDGDGEGDVSGEEEDGVDAGGEDVDGLRLELGLSPPAAGEGDLGTGEEAGEGVCGAMVECVGAGEGAWAVDIAMIAMEMASTSVARVNAMVARGRNGVKVTEEDAGVGGFEDEQSNGV